MAGIAQKTGRFFSNVVKELKRVSWPNRKELTKYTITVLTTVVFIVIFFYLVDLGLTWIIETFLD
ncbi:preprotein translocase subunit SecE [Pseudalkalibacillus salsuginis]|uniref:preprotein translocase subunit SecE n=1 Tax=Pseudalkalibacillus salsuginis TaxID=2910972 RepID=UPI001F33E96B|nr:preprotein translocase subunit SecE [Pseudalkalibacillus salsuginis]MCF6411870.1 preprotein translocase subunit SecE [Pseudalkalibacillus salsuginis]